MPLEQLNRMVSETRMKFLEATRICRVSAELEGPIGRLRLGDTYNLSQFADGKAERKNAKLQETSTRYFLFMMTPILDCSLFMVPPGNSGESLIEPRPVQPFTPYHHTDGPADRSNSLEGIALYQQQVRRKPFADAPELILRSEELRRRDRSGSQRLIRGQPRGHYSAQLMVD